MSSLKTDGIEQVLCHIYAKTPSKDCFTSLSFFFSARPRWDSNTETFHQFNLFFFQLMSSNMSPMFGVILLFWHHPLPMQIFLSNITIHFSCDVSVDKDKMMRKSPKIWHLLRRSSQSGWRSSFDVWHNITFPSDPKRLSSLHNALFQ